MEAIKNVNDFKHFLKMNQEKIFSDVEKAKDISLDDDWMLEDEWDNLYDQGVNKEMNQYKIGEVLCSQFPFKEMTT